MKKIINLKENIVEDMLNGYVKAHSDRVKFAQSNNRLIIRKNPKIFIGYRHEVYRSRVLLPALSPLHM